jgi:hypothetical protein
MEKKKRRERREKEKVSSYPEMEDKSLFCVGGCYAPKAQIV